jgi:2-methylisocitrate lyase-like PEP mutase family enzyme
MSAAASASALRALHKPGRPLLIANVYDAITAEAIAALPSAKAIGTASFAVAAAAGLGDDDLDIDTNLRAVAAIAPIAKRAGKPLTVDFQDGYGSKLQEGITRLVELGVAGVNLEDHSREMKGRYTIEEAAKRVEQAMQAAITAGSPDFVLNARVDELVHGGTLDDAISRGKAYLAAGASNVFVWGGGARGGISRAEVEQLCAAFDGKLNVIVKLPNGGLTVNELAAIGVARCSLGPTLQFAAIEAVKKAAEEYLRI